MASIVPLDYNSSRLMKRSRALRGRNLTRNSQVRAGIWPPTALAACAAGAVLLLSPHILALLSLRKSNPNTTRNLAIFIRFDPQILRNILYFMLDLARVTKNAISTVKRYSRA